MPPRVVLLRVMLWSLALAAAAGVFAVLSLRTPLATRIVGTGIATAVACALLLPIATLMDRRTTRAAGLLGMSVVLLEFFFTLALIWELPRWLFSGMPIEEEILISMGLFAAACLLLMSLFRMQANESLRVASLTGTAAILGALPALLIAIWLRELGLAGREEDWAGTGAALFVCGELAAIALAGVQGGAGRHWRWVGVVAAAGALFLWLGGIWVKQGSAIGVLTFEALLFMSILVAHANLSCFCPLRIGQGWVRTSTVAAVFATLLLILWMEVSERLYGKEPADLATRLTSAAGILAGCGSLALTVFARLNRRVDYEPLAGEAVAITLVCPRCGRKQAVPVGDAACDRCGLRIHLRIEDPRCPNCEYLLYGLTSDRCPECGTSVTGTVPSLAGIPASSEPA